MMMLHFKRSSKPLALLSRAAPFSSAPQNEPQQQAAPQRKVTPSSPLKMPKLKENEEIIGFRPYGNTSLQTKPKMFNFRLQEEINEQRKFKLVILAVILSLVPFCIFLKNAEANFRKAGIKELHSKRRKRLDEEHGVNRDTMREDFDQLDKMYRITEKEEIQKYQQIGKSAQEYYQQISQQKAGEAPTQQQGAPVQDEPIIEGKTVKEGDLEVKYIKSGHYEQVQVLAGAVDNPDPRVGGSKIIFDSRLDKFSQPQTKDQAKDLIRERQKELPPYTLQDKKDLLKKMLSKKDEPKKAEVDAAETEESKQEAKRGFKRASQNVSFKNDSEAAPLYVPFSDKVDKRESLLLETVEQYNMIMAFLRPFDTPTREYLSFVIRGVIPHLNSLDQVSDFLAFIENYILTHPLAETVMTHHEEQLLSLKLAKPSIDWLMENPPILSDSIDSVLSLQYAVPEGIDAQVTLFKAVLPEVKRLLNALQSVNEYQQTLALLKDQSLALDQSKVDAFYAHIAVQLERVEEKLAFDHGHINNSPATQFVKLLDTEKAQTCQSLEHKLYSKHYQSLRDTIYANQNYKASRDHTENGDDFHQGDVQALRKDYEALVDGTQYMIGLRKVVTRDAQRQMAENFMGVYRDEMNFRLKMENDIMKDCQVIMGSIQDKLEELVKYLQAEEYYSSAQEVEREKTQRDILAGENPNFDQALLPHIETLVIPHEMIFQEVLTKRGAPSHPELQSQLDQLKEQLGLSSTLLAYINEEDNSELKVLISRANLSLKVRRNVPEAYAYLKEAYGTLQKTKGNVSLSRDFLEEFSTVLFKFEQRMFVERAIRDEINQNKEQYFDTVRQLARI